MPRSCSLAGRAYGNATRPWESLVITLTRIYCVSTRQAVFRKIESLFRYITTHTKRDKTQTKALKNNGIVAFWTGSLLQDKEEIGSRFKPHFEKFKRVKAFAKATTIKECEPKYCSLSKSFMSIIARIGEAVPMYTIVEESQISIIQRKTTF